MDTPKEIELIIKKLFSNQLLGKKELEKMDNWLRQVQNDPETEKLLQLRWEQSEDIDFEISFKEIRQRIEKRNESNREKKLQNYLLTFQKIAAILIIPIILVSIWLVLQNQHDETQWLALTTASGEHSHIYLPDSTEVWINVGSKLEYPINFNRKSRNLKLNGEAWFNVTKNKKLPFIVNTQNFSIRAIGTKFNISAYNDGSVNSAYLHEGIVEFNQIINSKNVKSATLKPRQIVTVSPQTNIAKITSEKTNIIGNWRSGELNFYNEPMQSVFKKTERWYNVKIEFDPNDFQNETLTVNLKEGEKLESLLKIIENAINVKINKTDNKYIVRKMK